MDEVNQEIHFPISHFLYHCFYKNGNLIKYMLLLLSLRFCLIIDNVGWLTDLSGEVEPLVSVIFYLILNQLMNISVNDWDKNLFSDKSKSPNGCKKIKVGSPK